MSSRMPAAEALTIASNRNVSHPSIQTSETFGLGGAGWGFPPPGSSVTVLDLVKALTAGNGPTGASSKAMELRKKPTRVTRAPSPAPKKPSKSLAVYLSYLNLF